MYTIYKIFLKRQDCECGSGLDGQSPERSGYVHKMATARILRVVEMEMFRILMLSMSV